VRMFWHLPLGVAQSAFPIDDDTHEASKFSPRSVASVG